MRSLLKHCWPLGLMLAHVWAHARRAQYDVSQNILQCRACLPHATAATSQQPALGLPCRMLTCFIILASLFLPPYLCSQDFDKRLKQQSRDETRDFDKWQKQQSRDKTRG